MEKFTNTNIQYEENIFYLKLTLNNIKKAPLLNVNRELFQKKIKDELLFIKKCCKVLFEKLIKNSKLITRDKLLHDILNLKNLYIETIRELDSRNYIKISEFSDYLDQYQKDIKYINSLLLDQDQIESKEDLTTNEELNILFMDNSNKDEE